MTRTRLSTAMTITGVLLLSAAPPSSAGAQTVAIPAATPNVYGPGILFACSGLDSRTPWTTSFVATTTSGGVGLEFRLPAGQTFRIHMPGHGLETLRFRAVTNDLVLADVPGDDRPLVMTFASSKVLVGRAPAGASVSLEGQGDVVLLRESEGRQTRFALGCETGDRRRSADLASEGLQVSLDTLVEDRLDFYAALPRAPRETGALEATALAKAFSVMKANVYSAEPPIGRRALVPARWPLGQIGLWETAVGAVGLSHLDTAIAKEALEAVYGFQADDGFIPGAMPPRDQSAVSGPPMLAWSAWQVYVRDKRRDRAFLERSHDAASRLVVWYMKKRRLGGAPPPEKALEDGTPLYAWASAEEAGRQGSPRFADPGAPGPDFAAVDLSCYLANECRTLQQMAQTLGFREIAKTHGRRASAIESAARQRLWDPEREFFFDRRWPDGPWSEVWASEGLLALWSGVASPEQADRLAAHLASGKFASPCPVPGVARDDPAYERAVWRGAVSPAMNALLVRGLERYGRTKEAAQVRARTLEMLTRWYGRTGVLYEFYDADDAAPPAGLARAVPPAPGAPAQVIGDYLPTAAALADLVLAPKP